MAQTSSLGKCSLCTVLLLGEVGIVGAGREGMTKHTEGPGARAGDVLRQAGEMQAFNCEVHERPPSPNAHANEGPHTWAQDTCTAESHSACTCVPCTVCRQTQWKWWESGFGIKAHKEGKLLTNGPFILCLASQQFRLNIPYWKCLKPEVFQMSVFLDLGIFT